MWGALLKGSPFIYNKTNEEKRMIQPTHKSASLPGNSHDKDVAAPMAAAGMESMGKDRYADILRQHSIPLTLQRLAIAQVLFARPVHLTAEQVLVQAQGIVPEISRATGYNTLKLFKEKGLVRELVIDPARIVYDSNTSHHYHIYDADTGEMTDIPAGDLKVVGSANLPADVELEEVDIIIRVHSKDH